MLMVQIEENFMFEYFYRTASCRGAQKRFGNVVGGEVQIGRRQTSPALTILFACGHGPI